MHATVAYQPIGAYGAIGNLRSVALSGLHGGIDWCCFPHLDSASVFGALLDHQRGGTFRVAPARGGSSAQRYWPETNILDTSFVSEEARLLITDWMPIEGDIDGCGRSWAEPMICRRLQAVGGALDVELTWSPRFDYAKASTTIRRTRGGFLAEGTNGERLVLTETFANALIVDDGHGPCVWARFRLTPAHPLILATRWDAHEAAPDPQAALATLERTAEIWRRWTRKSEARRVREWAAADADLLLRSELTLKLLTHGDTGAIAAAATTSLPEDIGGVRNWDYRFTWVRNASQLIESLLALGHRAEVDDFLHFVEHASENASSGSSLQVMFGRHGERDCAEATLSHLEG
jgi:GH15 family glucan-1,4-alpha-glucosidase